VLTPSFHDLNHQYVHEALKGKASQRFYLRLYAQYFGSWSEHPDKKTIRDWHRSKASTPAHANKGLGYLKALYNWAINEDLWSDANPASGIRRHATYDRERTMTNRELTVLMNALDMLFWKQRALLIVLLTTGCRLTEACSMEWTHIDLQANSWTKPKTKNGRPHRIPLPSQTCAALDALPRKGRYVLMGAYDQHFSRAAAEKMWGIVRRSEFLPTDKWPALRMPDVRLHDFRRTVASRLLDQGEPELLIKSVLNHHKGDVTAIYARSSFDKQAAALQKHADELWVLLKEVHDDSQHSLPFAVSQPVSLHYSQPA